MAGWYRITARFSAASTSRSFFSISASTGASFRGTDYIQANGSTAWVSGDVYLVAGAYATIQQYAATTMTRETGSDVNWIQGSFLRY